MSLPRLSKREREFLSLLARGAVHDLYVDGDEIPVYLNYGTPDEEHASFKRKTWWSLEAKGLVGYISIPNDPHMGHFGMTALGREVAQRLGLDRKQGEA